MRRVIAAGMLGLGACDQLFQLDTVERPMDGGTTASDADAQPVVDAFVAGCVSDDFSTDTLGVTWEPYGGVAPSVMNGELVVTLADSTAGTLYGGALLGRRPATGYHSTARVELTTTSQFGAEAFMSWTVDAGNYYMMYVTGGLLLARMRRQQVDTQVLANLSYVPDLHRHWEIRHDPVGKTVAFATSPDRNVWTMQAQVTSDVPVDRIRLELAAGTFSAVSNPGQVQFDDVVFCDD